MACVKKRELHTQTIKRCVLKKRFRAHYNITKLYFYFYFIRFRYSGAGRICLKGVGGFPTAPSNTLLADLTRNSSRSLQPSFCTALCKKRDAQRDGR